MSTRRTPSRRAARPSPNRWFLGLAGIVAVVTGLSVLPMVPALFGSGPSASQVGASVVTTIDDQVGEKTDRPVSRSSDRGSELEESVAEEAGAAPGNQAEPDVAEEVEEAEEAFQRLRERQEQDERAATRAQRKLRKANAKKTSTFRVGTFNILGSQHTRGSRRYESGPVRAGVTAGLITSRGVDVVGMQEVQVDQLPPLLNGLSGYTIWPQTSLGGNTQRLQIAWRSSRFEAVEKRTSTYVFTSQQIPLPMVLLRDRESGAEFWVMNIHNSAGSMQDQRDRATAHQIGLVQGLMRETGKPVLVTGDMNEHEKFYQRMCAATGFAGANGGGGPSCHLPPRPLRVDWVMGGGGGGVNFSGYVQDGASLARASDHYFIHAGVTVTDSGGTP